MAKAIWEGVVLAEADDIVVVEGNSYFPTGALRREYFKPSNQTTHCPWKGTAHYYDVEVNGKKNAGAAWYYPEPSEAANGIRGRVAFWRGVQVA
jgi:uncharacterized protein (DUF427 family)